MSEDQAFSLFSYISNLHFLGEEVEETYKNSKVYDEGDIHFYFGPNTQDEDHPEGFGISDAPHNYTAVFGLRYFGKSKKGTLTLAWTMAHRNGYIACYDGRKPLYSRDRDDKVFTSYGLSSSDKSTLTHEMCDDKYDIIILHDGAFIISREDGSLAASEPSYFDKTHGYPVGHHETKYYTTTMDCVITQDEDGRKVIIAEDSHGSNGRVIKTRYTSPHRVDYEDAPITALFWIMKDGLLSPILEVDDLVSAIMMGLTLATKRTSVESLPEGFDMNTLVIEPFADPFHTYPASGDYSDFKELFTKHGASCYILSTDAFMGKDIPKEAIKKLAGDLANGSIKDSNWRPFGNFKGVPYLSIEGYEIHLEDPEYQKTLAKGMQNRLDWLNKYDEEHPTQPIQEGAEETLESIIKELN